LRDAHDQRDRQGTGGRSRHAQSARELTVRPFHHAHLAGDDIPHSSADKMDALRDERRDGRGGSSDSMEDDAILDRLHEAAEYARDHCAV
jgi:hypothetical protein